ncbi:hypothetical protein ACSQ67_023603 [Phaseolus vulgaris]
MQTIRRQTISNDDGKGSAKMTETSTGFGRRITVPTVFPVVYVVASEDMDSLTFGARFFYASKVGCVRV